VQRLNERNPSYIYNIIWYDIIRKTVKWQFTAAARVQRVGPDLRVSKLPPPAVNGLSERHRCRLVVCQLALQIELKTTVRGKELCWWAHTLHEILCIYIYQLPTTYIYIMYCEFNAIKSGPAREMYLQLLLMLLLLLLTTNGCNLFIAFVGRVRGTGKTVWSWRDRWDGERVRLIEKNHFHSRESFRFHLANVWSSHKYCIIPRAPAGTVSREAAATPPTPTL